MRRTDTLGSIRIPAAYCGVYGLKPTLGAVSTDGLVHLGTAFDVIGPLARDLDVLERVWDTLKCSLDTPVPRRRPRNIIILANLANIEVQPAVVAAYEHILARLGGTPQALTLADRLPVIRLAALLPCVQELKIALGDARTGPLVSDEIKTVIAAVEQLPAAPDVLTRTKSALEAALGNSGVLVMPTAPQVAFAHDTRAPANQADFTCLASVAGLPALSIPAGEDADGLPIGVQLVGPAGSETALIVLARTLAMED
jgi:aspartyl-tRNA(Asn)/glutamyl-tRNA(Gln) amidotransferase subunit A